MTLTFYPFLWHHPLITQLNVNKTYIDIVNGQKFELHIRLECGQRINFFIIYDFCRSMHSRDCPILTNHPWWIISDLLSPLTTELSKECSLWTWFKEKRLLCHIFVWYLKLNKNKRLRKRIKKTHQDGWKTILPQANVISYY